MTATLAPAKPLHLHRLDVENFMRVQALTVDADGKHVVIKGRNGSGKTSSVDAIWFALGGVDSKACPEPIHNGAQKAAIRLDLGEYVVERHFSPAGSRLVITAADGSRINKPQQLLDGLLGQYALDPVAFLDRRPQDQVDDVLAICAIEPPVDAVAKITGEVHEARPGEKADAYMARLSADDVGVYFTRRRDAHRDKDQKEKALREAEQTLEAMGGVPDNIDEFDQTAIVAKIEQLELQAAQRREKEADLHDCGNNVVNYQTQLASLEQQSQRADLKIKELERKLADEREEAASLAKRIARGKELIEEAKADQDRAMKDVVAIADPAPELARYREALARAGRERDNLVKRQHQGQQVEQLKSELEIANDDWTDLDDQLSKLRTLRKQLLDGLDLGVDGLEVGNGEIRLNGLPFRQASLAQRLRVACAVAMRQNPRLRLLRVDNGEHLDQDSRRLLLDLASANDWQVVMTCVADNADLRVEVVDEAA